MPWLESPWQDLRQAARLLRRTPGFTAVTILTLALGIGANTAIFSLVDTLMLRPLPVHEPTQLVELVSTYPGEPRHHGFNWKHYEHFRDQNHVFSDLIGVAPVRFQIGAAGGDGETVPGEYVAGTFFQALGVQAAMGRLLGPEDDQLDAEAGVAVVSWSYWQGRLNRDPAVLGSRLVLNGVPATIVGVAPREFVGLLRGLRPDVWVPVAFESMIARPSRRADGSLTVGVMGRLKPGVSIDQARAELSALDRGRTEEIASRSKDPLWRQVTLEVEPASAGFSLVRDHFGKPLLVLMTVVGLLLVIACTNVASLLMARASVRQREMAVRGSLGATPLRLVRQVLTEALLLSLSGALLGVAVAYFGANALVRIMMSGRLPPSIPQGLEIQVQPDGRVLLFTIAVALCTGVLFGLAPAWRAFASAPAPALRGSGSAAETKSRRLFGNSLVVAQVALSIVLLSAAGLFIRHLWNLRNVDLGFQRESVLLVMLDPRDSGYDRAQLSAVYQDLLGRLERIPGVRSATLSGVTPIQGPGASGFVNFEGIQQEPGSRRYVAINWVGPSYFATLGTPWIAGRDFQFADAGRPRVAIVNQALARYYFGAANPIGRHLTREGEDRPYEIIGVAGDAKYLTLHESAPRTVYFNAFQDERIFSQFALRTSTAPEAVAGEVQRVVRDTLSNVRVSRVRTLADQVDASIVPERVMAMLAGLFGALGAALAGLGLYGLLAYTVARRTNEIAIRIALGATRSHVTTMVLKGAFGLVCAGLAAGVPIAIASRRLTASWIENLPAENLSIIPVAATAMFAVALLSAFVPARRAAHVDPIDALRRE